MRFPLLLLFVAFPAALPAADPPHLAAAKERHRKAKAFEAVVSYTTTWREGEGTLTDTGTAHLIADGERFWYRLEYRNMALFGGVRLHRSEMAFDGSFHHLMVEDKPPMFAALPKPVCVIDPTGRPGPWPWQFDPLRHVVRGFDFPLARAEPTGDPAGGGRERYGGTDPSQAALGTAVSLDLDPERTFAPDRLTTALTSGGKATSVLEYRYPADDRRGWVPTGWTLSLPNVPSAARTTTATVESFALRESIPAERFTVRFPVGSRVNRHTDGGVEELVVAEDGSLVSVPSAGNPPAEPPPPSPLEPPSTGRAAAVVGVTVALFAGLVLLLRRLGRGPQPEPEPVRPNV